MSSSFVASAPEQLSDSQREALDQFTAVTAQTSSQAIPHLSRAQWNVELAISRFFDGETGDSVAEALQAEEYARAAAAPPPPQPAARPNPTLTRRFNSGITPAPRIVPQRDGAARRPPLLISLLLFPFSLVWRIANGAVSLIYLIFPFLPRPRTLAQSPSTTNKRSNNPRDTAARFIRAFEEENGNENGLQWFEGGYAQALDLAKKDLRFLLVILQSDEHDDTLRFNKLTLSSESVVAFIKANNIILWGGSVQESEAYQVSTALGCTKFPFAALITHAPNTPPGASSQGMSVVARVVGSVSAAAFVQKLQTAISAHSPALDHIRATRAAQAADREILTQQNSAYDISLARDRQRAAERKAAEEAAQRAKAEAEQAVTDAVNRAEKRSQWRRWRAARIAEEPTDGAVARVSIRTADGNRIIRKFAKEAQMEEVYAFVECLDLVGGEKVGGEKPHDYEHEYDFRLVSVMPRKEFDPAERGTVGEHLWPSGNLVVESVHELEESDDE